MNIPFNYIDFHVLEEFIDDRQIVIWGTDKVSLEIFHGLENQWKVAAFISDDEIGEIENIPIQSSQFILNLSMRYYFILAKDTNNTVTKFLEGIGYEEQYDFQVVSGKRHIEVWNTTLYKDIYGNEIIGKLENCKVIFKGMNAKLIFGKHFKAYQNCKIILESNCLVKFGDNFTMGKDNVFYFRDNSYFKIGSDCTFTNYIRIYNRGRIEIGNKFGIRDFGEIRILGQLLLADYVYFQHHVSIYAPKDSLIKIGNDSGASWYTRFLADAGHSIYDLKHKMKFNDLSEKKIIIGNHVWIGSGSTIFNSTDVSDHAMIAANSIVKGKFKQGTLVSGNPARIIMDEIDWDMRNDLSYEEYIEYKNNGQTIIPRAVYLEEFSE